MRTVWLTASLFLIITAFFIVTVQALADGEKQASWTRWGGPSQNFQAPAQNLAATWPADGPEKLWSRELGQGYSAILADQGRLYTQYREGAVEVVICLDARTGETVWEHRYEHRPHAKHVHAYGDGPSSTPLLAGDLLFTVGVAGKMHALQKSDGKVVWTRDLWPADFDGDFDVKILGHGYSSSPVAYDDTVIVPIGGENNSLVAFDQQDGSVRWRALSFENSYSSPRLMKLVGEEQLVIFMAEELIGVDPKNGELRWRYPHGNPWAHNISMPLAVDDDMIFLSSPQSGARGIRLRQEGDAIKVEEAWSNRRFQIYHVSSVRQGDWVYGTTGTGSVAFMTAINVRTGEVAWRERGIGKANCVAADGKLVILDQDGMLYLATVTPEKLVVHAQAQLLERVAWTVPTIVGQTMYVRDNRQIMAVSLGG